MTEQSGSYPDPFGIIGEEPLRLIGQEWVDHGYPITPIFEEVEPCPICDMPNQVCTEEHAYPPPNPEVWP